MPIQDERDQLESIKAPLERESQFQGTHPQDDIFKDKMDDKAQDIEDQIAGEENLFDDPAGSPVKVPGE